MSGGWTTKRFWTASEPVASAGGWGVALDGRPVRTPSKAPLVVPSRGLAVAIAAEWDAQHGRVNPATMPMTRAANSAIDKVTPLFDAVVGEIAGYGGSDLICYRAVHPPALIARQAAGWDPLVGWAAKVLGAPLTVTQGVVPVAQPAASLARLRARVAGLSPFGLTALHDLVSMSGSLVIGLAVAAGRLAPATGWDLSRIDETWQAELWGRDEEAEEIAARKRSEFLDAYRFWSLLGPDGQNMIV